MSRPWIGWGVLIAILAALLLLFVRSAPAHAQEPGVWLPRHEAAELFGLAAENAALRAKIETLEAQVATLERRDAIREEIEALKDEKYALQEELTTLARQAAVHWKARVESEREEARKAVKTARIQGYAATGAAVGTVVMPGVGTLVGGGIGALAGWLSP